MVITALMIAKNTIGNKIETTVSVNIISKKVGIMLKELNLKMFAKDCEPLDTILITFPVSRER